MVEIKKTMVEMMSAFNGFINRMDTAKKRIIEETSIATSQTNIQIEKIKGKKYS